MKKLISLLLSMAMVFSMTAVQVLAADEETAMLADTDTEGTDAPVVQTVTLDLSQGTLSFPPQAIRRAAGTKPRLPARIRSSRAINLTSLILSAWRMVHIRSR